MHEAHRKAAAQREVAPHQIVLLLLLIANLAAMPEPAKAQSAPDLGDSSGGTGASTTPPDRKSTRLNSSH